MANSITCLICNDNLNLHPTIVNGGDSDNSKKRSQFQEGLQLFCKLLKITGNCVDNVILIGGNGNGENNVIGIPCCKECGLAFEQMIRLQQAIELMQANLMEQLDKLKLALHKSVLSDHEEDPLKIPPDDILGKIRDQLVSWVLNSSTPSTSDRHNHQSYRKSKPGPKSSKSKQPVSVISSKKSKECQPCSVILERLPINLTHCLILPEEEHEADLVDITIKQEIPSFDETTTYSNDLIGGDCGRRVRKSKQKAFEIIRKHSTPQRPPTFSTIKDDWSELNDEDYIPSPESPLPSPSNHDNDYEEEYPWETEAKPIPQKLPRTNRYTCMTNTKQKFSLISPDTLLYQYTLIKVSQGYNQFTCQEPECPSPHFYNSSFNCTDLFNEIADHIKLVHSPLPTNEEIERSCPLCPLSFLEGPHFRAHLIGTGRLQRGHRIETVICEICLRPIRNLADAYRTHQWYHKSEQEKENSLEGPPPTLLSKAKRYKKSQDESVLKPGVKRKQKEKKHKFILELRKKVETRVILKDNPNMGEARPRGIRMKIHEHFCRVLENSREYLLIYKYTLVKALYGVSLTCQEINCNHILNGTDFLAFEQFKNHVKTCHEPQNSEFSPQKCPLCPQKLKSAETFRYHMIYKCPMASSSSVNLRYICTVCLKPMNSTLTLEYHQWLHKSELEKETTAAQEHLPHLVQVKKNEKQSQLKCRYCQREFNSLTNLRAHEATHLPKEQRKKYMCHQCPRQFLSPVAVRAHVEREHQRELMRVRSCPICSQQFNYRNGHSFRAHLRSHRNVREFVCEECGKAFKDKGCLIRHREKVHEGKGQERIWQCEFCEMNYKEKKHLNRHKKNAHKDKVEGDEVKGKVEEKVFYGPKIAFPCPVCEKAFPLRSRMKKHYEKFCKVKEVESMIIM